MPTEIRPLWVPLQPARKARARRIILTPAGLEAAEGAEDEVQTLPSLLRLAAKRRIEAPYQPAKVSTSDIAGILGPDGAAYLKRVQSTA